MAHKMGPAFQTNETDIGNNIIRFCAQNSGTLVISFDAGGRRHAADPARPGFGQKFLVQAGFDAMFVLPKQLDWYQTPELATFFLQRAADGFFKKYKRIVTYGSSMGGFAALAYSKYVGATHVIALQPRTTLIHSQARWRSSFSRRMTIRQNGPLADALDGLNNTAAVSVFFDPFFKRDAIHASRLIGKGPNIRLLKIPFVGHTVPSFLAQTGQLQTVFNMALAPEFDAKYFYRLTRQRRNYAVYHRRLSQALINRL